jgi:hypothetical protein
MKANERRAAAFRRLDLHDDTLLDLRVSPPSGRKRPTSVCLELVSTWGAGRRRVTFSECANLVIRLDCDVLGDNWPINTSGVTAQTDPGLLQQFARAQRRIWDVSYGRTHGRDASPLPQKVSQLSRLTLYRVQLFGGRVEVLAREFSVQESKSSGASKKSPGRRTRG